MMEKENIQVENSVFIAENTIPSIGRKECVLKSSKYSLSNVCTSHHIERHAADDSDDLTMTNSIQVGKV